MIKTQISHCYIASKWCEHKGRHDNLCFSGLSPVPGTSAFEVSNKLLVKIISKDYPHYALKAKPGSWFKGFRGVQLEVK